MSGPGSINNLHGAYSHVPDHPNSKAADSIRNGQPQQRQVHGSWPEDIGNDGSRGGFDAAALAGKATRFLTRLDAAPNRGTRHVASESDVAGQAGAADSLVKGAGAAVKLIVSVRGACKAAKPLVAAAKAGEPLQVHELIVVANAMLPELKAAWRELRNASRLMKKAAGNNPKQKEADSLTHARQ